MCKIPSVALTKITMDERYADIPISREIAAAVERSPSTVSRVLSEKTTLDQNQCARLGRKLCDDFGDKRFSRCFVGESFDLIPRRFGRANGRHDDDAADATEVLGQWITAMNAGDEGAARSALDDLKSRVIPNMDAETNNL